MFEINELRGKFNAGTLLQSIEKSWELLWVLRILCIGLFLDSALIQSTSFGLIDWAAGEEISLNAAWIILLVMAFCTLVGVVFPAVIWTLQLFALFFPRKNYELPSDHAGFAPQRVLLREAIENESDFLLGWHQSQQQANEAARKDLETLSNMMSQLLLFIFVNLAVGLKEPTANAITLSAWEWAHFSLQLVAFFCFLTALEFVWSSWRNAPRNYIFYPQANQKMEPKKKA